MVKYAFKSKLKQVLVKALPYQLDIYTTYGTKVIGKFVPTVVYE